MTTDTRAAAALAIAGVLEGGSLNQLLPAALETVAERDRGLLQQLCYGTLRHYPRLQPQLQQLLSKPLKNRDRDIEALLLLGLPTLRAAWSQLRSPEVAWRVAIAAGLLALHFGAWVASLTMTTVPWLPPGHCTRSGPRGCATRCCAAICGSGSSWWASCLPRRSRRTRSGCLTPCSATGRSGRMRSWQPTTSSRRWYSGSTAVSAAARTTWRHWRPLTLRPPRGNWHRRRFTCSGLSMWRHCRASPQGRPACRMKPRNWRHTCWAPVPASGCWMPAPHPAARPATCWSWNPASP